MRQSLIRRQPTKRCREGNNKHKLSHQTNKYRRTKLHRFTILLHNVKSAKSEAILRHGKVASPTWFVGTSTMCGYSRIERANSGRLYKKFIADRRYHNSSFLTPHSSFHKHRFLHKKSLAISAILCYTNQVCLKMQ